MGSFLVQSFYVGPQPIPIAPQFLPNEPQFRPNEPLSIPLAPTPIPLSTFGGFAPFFWRVGLDGLILDALVG